MPNNPWVRYADDGVIHCTSKEQAEAVLAQLVERMEKCKLEIHPDKTKIVYCGDNKSDEEETSFEFLGYTFRKRTVRTKNGKLRTGFTPAVSNTKKKAFRKKIKETIERYGSGGLETLEAKLNPIISGWLNYFDKFTPSEAKRVLNYVDLKLIQWLRRKYKSVRRSMKRARKLLVKIAKDTPTKFYHWKIGVTPAMG